MMADYSPVLTDYIEKRRFGDRPHIRGRRVPVSIIASAARDNTGVGVPELADAYGLSETEVLAALLYYAHHQEEIDTQEAQLAAKYPGTEDSGQP